ncbi:MAG: putative beta-lysine N-acetyltransferase, partial [Methanomicrobiales archaeon]|nr:putative beta-lysine N-acetyltransferase [Methanomicrobiales archaeon]
KLVVKAPSQARNQFLDAGFIEEARIPGFFPAPDDCLFLSRFFSFKRMEEQDLPAYEQIIGQCLALGEGAADIPLPPRYAIRACSGRDAKDLAGLYASVFPSYPFPIDNPTHIRTMMEHDTRFYAIFHDQGLAAAASAEMDPSTGTVEMTDFATSRDHRGRGLARRLLSNMEQAVSEEGMRVAYTIARAGSPAMNAIFARSGYRFGGRLVNNTHICGSLESMNVWYKRLA